MRWALLGLVAGCAPELGGDAVVFHGRHVTVHADPAVPVCEESVAVADRFVEDVAALVQVPPPAIDYYLFDGPTGCGSDQYATSSCEIGGSVYANAWIHFHELAHAVDGTRPPALFVEGFAEAMSWPIKLARTTKPPPDVELPLESTAFRAGDANQNYALGGSLVRYLLERFGMARYRAFARSLVSLSDRVTIERAFEQAYEQPLADVVASWRAADPAAAEMTLPIDLVECGDPVPPVAADTWSADSIAPTTCTSGQTQRGTVYAQYPHRFGFEVIEPGLFAIQLATSGPATTALWTCPAATRSAFVAPAAGTPVTVLPLDAGRHALELGDGVQAWRIARLGAVATTCDTAPVLQAPAREGWRVDLRGKAGTWVRVEQHEDRPLFVAPRVPVRVCAGDCSRGDCSRVTGYTIFEHDAARRLAIELAPGSPEMPIAIVGTLDGH